MSITTDTLSKSPHTGRPDTDPHPTTRRAPGRVRNSIRSVPRALTRRRVLAWTGVITVLLAASAAALSFGELPLSLADIFSTLTGGGTDESRLVVLGWRLPRAVLAVVIGAMLGLSGALFQIVTRNPLGSPDILGFSTGAYTGALLVITAGSATTVGLAFGALAGGIASAALVLGLAAWRGASGVRLIIVGIAVTALLGAVNLMIQISADDLVAHAAAIWGAGSLNGIDGAWVLPLVLTLALCAALLVPLSSALSLAELGDERAAGLGVRPGRLRIWAMLIGVVLLAAPIAAVGPISFIALAAPQIARRIWGSGTIPFAATAAVGAALLAVSDVLAMRLFAPTILPTGLITIGLGGIYLAWALTIGARK